MPKPLFVGLFAALVAAGAAAQPHRDQDEALAARRAGQALPLRQIEAQILPQMAGCDYLGPEYLADTGMYRLKFMRGGAVIWVDVDARTGRVRGRSDH